MACACISNRRKMIISLQTAVIAFVIFNPALFQIVRSVLGSWVASSDGLPSISGLILHAIIFGIIIYLSMKPKILRQNEQSLQI